MGIKLLMGGSPCNHWSIAKRNRETSCEGLGWELFRNYIIAKEKFEPDFFIYENVESVSKEIKQQIMKQLGVGNDCFARFTYINSGLVSGQNRKRFYVTNFGEIQLPTDRGILMKDLLETDGVNVSGNKKSYCITATYSKATLSNTLDRKQRTIIAEPVIQRRPLGNNDDKSDKSKEVKNGQIEINGRLHKIKLVDGFYNFRKLTVTECERLQTLPDGYCKAIAKEHAYKAIGNCWTAEVVIHLLSHVFSNVPRDEEIIVLSLYDGIATGRYCLDKMGFTNVTYYAYETDKHAVAVAMDNYPDIIQCGDAFAVREENWKI